MQSRDALTERQPYMTRPQSFVPALLFFSLLGLTLSPRSNWSVPPLPRAWVKLRVPDRAFIGSIDSPLTVQAGEYLPVFGYAAATAPQVTIAKLEVWVDGAKVVEITDFQPRPDLSVAFDRPNFEVAGWRCVLSTRTLKLGQHELEVRSNGSDGSSGIVQTAKLTIIP
jgi:hypothetical protein